VPYDKIFKFEPRYQIEGYEVDGQELEEDTVVHENEDVLVQLMCRRVETEV